MGSVPMRTMGASITLLAYVSLPDIFRDSDTEMYSDARWQGKYLLIQQLCGATHTCVKSSCLLEFAGTRRWLTGQAEKEEAGTRRRGVRRRVEKQKAAERLPSRYPHNSRLLLCRLSSEHLSRRSYSPWPDSSIKSEVQHARENGANTEKISPACTVFHQEAPCKACDESAPLPPLPDFQKAAGLVSEHSTKLAALFSSPPSLPSPMNCTAAACAMEQAAANLAATYHHISPIYGSYSLSLVSAFLFQSHTPKIHLNFPLFIWSHFKDILI